MPTATTPKSENSKVASAPPKLRGSGTRTAYACPTCGKAAFRIIVGFVYWDFDIIEDEPELPAQEFFNVFLLYCTCAECGHVAEPTEFGKL